MSDRRKPRDIGNGLVCASFGRSGEWLSLATVDPEAGFVELTGLPLFDPELHGNAEAALRYHSWMRREAHAFLRLEAGRATITTREDAPRGSLTVVQRVAIRATRRDRPATIRLRVTGRLARPALAEVRETGPGSTASATPATSAATAGSVGLAAGSKSRVKAREGTLRVSGDGAPVIVQAWLRQAAGSSQATAGHGAAHDRPDRRLAWTVLRRRTPTAEAVVEWPDETDEVHLDIACTFDRLPASLPDQLPVAAPDPPPAVAPDRPPATGPDRPPQASPGSRAVGSTRVTSAERRPLRVPARLTRTIGQLDQRAATYIRTCTALQVSDAERCLLADHRIQPLSVTRDAYWQARLLLTAWARGGHNDDAALVADHLRWLFLRCERPDGRWARTHHADGRPHDPTFRVDTQLYPLLELADYVSATGDLPDLPADRSWADLAGEAWAAVESAVDPTTGLVTTEVDGTDETRSRRARASDQVLLWHAATRLAGTAELLGLMVGRFTERAEHARAAFAAHLLTDGPRGPQWAGAVDGLGGVEQAIDANDLPLALAPLWGFCKTSDRAWRAAMAFAFDPANPAFVPGPAGGLGARQLPGTWTLGDIFAWIAHGLAGEGALAESALERLSSVAFSDGMLPQAYDPQGSGDVARHWFALPGALLGALVLGHAARGSDQSDSR